MTPADIARSYGRAEIEQLPPDHQIRRAWQDAPEDRRVAIEQAVIYLRHKIAGPLLSGRPTPDVAAQMILGIRPTTIAPQLTRAEAAEWVEQSDHPTPEAWLWGRLGIDGSPHWSIDVIRWIESCLADPQRKQALYRDRGPVFGDHVEGSIISRLDEIEPSDLRPSPTETIERAVQRAAKSNWDGPDELQSSPPWEADLPDGVRLLRTATALCLEAFEMRHCTHSYSSRVASGEVVIVSIVAADGSRSTCSWRHGSLDQHVGPRNEQPSEACRAIARKIGGLSWPRHA